MRAGRLDRQITLEFVTRGQSASKEPTEDWSTIPPVTVWAEVRPVSGREYYAAVAAQIVADEMLAITIRHRTDVRPGTARVKYDPGDGEKTYNIRRVAEIGRRDGLTIFAETVTA
jgi:SPP1 family predicted phage head-tail adaptor